MPSWLNSLLVRSSSSGPANTTSDTPAHPSLSHDFPSLHNHLLRDPCRNFVKTVAAADVGGPSLVFTHPDTWCLLCRITTSLSSTISGIFRREAAPSASLSAVSRIHPRRKVRRMMDLASEMGCYMYMRRGLMDEYVGKYVTTMHVVTHFLIIPYSQDSRTTNDSYCMCRQPRCRTVHL